MLGLLHQIVIAGVGCILACLAAVFWYWSWAVLFGESSDNYHPYFEEPNFIERTVKGTDN
jgi:protein-S-isoprenylcysteine O-methyltransferase Ste14